MAKAGTTPAFCLPGTHSTACRPGVDLLLRRAVGVNAVLVGLQTALPRQNADETLTPIPERIGAIGTGAGNARCRRTVEAAALAFVPEAETIVPVLVDRFASRRMRQSSPGGAAVVLRNSCIDAVLSRLPACSALRNARYSLPLQCMPPPGADCCPTADRRLRWETGRSAAGIR